MLLTVISLFLTKRSAHVVQRRIICRMVSTTVSYYREVPYETGCAVLLITQATQVQYPNNTEPRNRRYVGIHIGGALRKDEAEGCLLLLLSFHISTAPIASIGQVHVSKLTFVSFTDSDRLYSPHRLKKSPGFTTIQ